MATVLNDVDEQLAGALRAQGLRVTSQRLVIHRLLREHGGHVTAEEVMGAVEPGLPGTSLPTVYATLELFEELGIVRRVHPGRGPVLFDSRLDEHPHVRCRHCGRVSDLEGSGALQSALRAAQDVAEGQGFTAERAEVVVSGVCADCRIAGAG